MQALAGRRSLHGADKRKEDVLTEDRDTQRPGFDPGRYLGYDDLTELLRAWAAAHPSLVSLASIARSAEGREVWLITVTDFDKAAAADKPAVYLDGNIHAGEVLGSAVCLYIVWDLISRFGHDEEVTDLLRTRAFYVCRRVSPDGAERYLTTPESLRSAPIPWPGDVLAKGLRPMDLDGNGVITHMRLLDPLGEWRVSDLDDRLMVRRRVGDPGGTAYRLVTEGVVEGNNAADLAEVPSPYGLDFNRSFPHAWQPEPVQSGAGPYPLYPAETRGVADFFLAHPNIGAVVAFHTHGGFVYHLPSSGSAVQYRHNDRSGPYRMFTDAYTEITGAPAVQSYDEASATGRHGSFIDWVYNQHGVYGWVPELWNLRDAAGLPAPSRDHFAELTEADEAALLRWNDEALDGAGFVDWSPFDHPQLGAVEIGGWTRKFTHQNAPPRYVPEIARRHAEWTHLLARALPEVAIEKTEIEPLGNGLWSLSVRAINTGFLPTNLSVQALEVGRAEEVAVSVEGEGVTAIGTRLRATVGHLDGYGVGERVLARVELSGRRRGTARFVLRVPESTRALTVRVVSAKAGAVSRTVRLTEDPERDAGVS